MMMKTSPSSSLLPQRPVVGGSCRGIRSIWRQVYLLGLSFILFLSLSSSPFSPSSTNSFSVVLGQTATPTESPSALPTRAPTAPPSRKPTRAPTHSPSRRPTAGQPTLAPTVYPTSWPTSSPTVTFNPTPLPTSRPSSLPSGQPTLIPVFCPTSQPTNQPTTQPTTQPTAPTGQPTSAPSGKSKAPTPAPSRVSRIPTRYKYPTSQPTGQPSLQPFGVPSSQPSTRPTSKPSVPTSQPSGQPSGQPTEQPIVVPSTPPTSEPTTPTSEPTSQPSVTPVLAPSVWPTGQPTGGPTTSPTCKPVAKPTWSKKPTHAPSIAPTPQPTGQPTSRPSTPTSHPTSRPTIFPVKPPTPMPTAIPVNPPTSRPSRPTYGPTQAPTYAVTEAPTTAQPTNTPVAPTFGPTKAPTRTPTVRPTSAPSSLPSSQPSKQPVMFPTGEPSAQPSMAPTAPTGQPSSVPSGIPSSKPTPRPSISPKPTAAPVFDPTSIPTSRPTSRPTVTPTLFLNPTPLPTSRPSTTPTSTPTVYEAATSTTSTKTTFYGVTGYVEFDPDVEDICYPVQMTIYIQFDQNLTTASTFQVFTPGMTSGPCTRNGRGRNINILSIPNNDLVSAMYYEGTPTNNYQTSSILFTVKGSYMDAAKQHIFVIDRSNELRRSCSLNETWTVEATQYGQGTGVVGSLTRNEIFKRKCLLYAATLRFTSTLLFFYTGFNLTIFPAFRYSTDVSVTVKMPGFTNKIAAYALNTMRNGSLNYAGEGKSVELNDLTWGTTFGWTGYWIEGKAEDNYKDSKVIFYPKAYSQLNKIFWIAVPKSRNHIIPVCSHPGNASDMVVYANSTHFYTPETVFTNVDTIGRGCDDFNGCNNKGICDYCKGTCDCQDGYGSIQDKLHVLIDDFAPDCSTKACPTGPAIGVLDAVYNSTKVSKMKNPADPMDMHRYIECSNNGYCDRSKGVCKCNKGFTGPACERLQCPGTPPCNGRGKCMTMQRLAAYPQALPLTLLPKVYDDVNRTTHKTWDQKFGQQCVCDSSWAVGLQSGEIQLAEFFGPSCEFRRCPSGDDPNTHTVNETDCSGISQTGGIDLGLSGNICHIDCSNRGICDYNTGICECFKGFSGANCGIRV